MIAASHADGVHIQLVLYNRSARDLDDVRVHLEGFCPPLNIAFSDFPCTRQNDSATVHFGTIEKQHTVCCHGLISLK